MYLQLQDLWLYLQLCDQVQARIESGFGYLGYILFGSTEYDLLYKTFCSDLDSALDHIDKVVPMSDQSDKFGMTLTMEANLFKMFIADQTIRGIHCTI